MNVLTMFRPPTEGRHIVIRFIFPSVLLVFVQTAGILKPSKTPLEHK